MSLTIDRALHRLEDLPGRVFRRDVGELEAPDRGGGDDDEGQRREVADRLQVDADGRQVVEHRHRAEDECKQQCAGAFAARTFGAAVHSPEDVDAGDEDAGEAEHDQTAERTARRIVAPRVMAHRGNQSIGEAAEQAGGAACDPEEQRRQSIGLPSRDERRREVKDRGGKQCGEEIAEARPGQCDAGVARGVHHAERSEPSGRTDGDGEEHAARTGAAAADEDRGTEEQNRQRRQDRRERQRAHGVHGTGEECVWIGHGQELSDDGNAS
jgi:hypothetical protein